MKYLIGYNMVYLPQVPRLTYRSKLVVVQGFCQSFRMTDPPCSSFPLTSDVNGSEVHEGVYRCSLVQGAALHEYLYESTFG